MIEVFLVGFLMILALFLILLREKRRQRWIEMKKTENNWKMGSQKQAREKKKER